MSKKPESPTKPDTAPAAERRVRRHTVDTAAPAAPAAAPRDVTRHTVDTAAAPVAAEQPPQE